MKNIITSLSTLTLTFIILYFFGEIVEKGCYLNQVTPIPIFGYLLWLVAALFILKVVVLPICSFIRLTRAEVLTKVDLVKRLHKQLRARTNSLSTERTPLQQEAWEAYKDIDTTLKLHHGSADLEESAAALLEKYAHLDTYKTDADKVVMNYAKSAAVGVVLSRNSMLDGLTLLFFQMKMVIELCRIYGYKPSVVFNLACFGWVLFHSVVATIMQDAAQSAGSQMIEPVIRKIVVEDSLLQVPAQFAATSIVSMLLEGANAGVAVYLTGGIFRSCLDGKAKRLSSKDLVSLRSRARKDIFKAVLSAVNPIG